MSEQGSLFGDEQIPIGKGNNLPKKRTKKKTAKQIKQEKDEFLKELQEMDCTPEKTNVELEAADELQKLNAELEQDKQDGLLYDDEPFYIKDKKLVVVRYQDQINANLPQLAKNIIDSKWKQNINPKNIEVNFDLDEQGNVIYESVICVSEFGVRFRVILDEILDKLKKIPFDE